VRYVRRRPRRRRAYLFQAATSGTFDRPLSLTQVLPVGGRRRMSAAKATSGGLLLLLAGLLAYLFVSYDFYVYRAEVVRARFLSPRQVFERSRLDGMSIFYVRPGEVAERLEAVPWVKEAEVVCGFPNQVRITLYERKVAFVWQNGGEAWGVDDEGVLLRLSEAEEDVLWVEDRRQLVSREGLDQTVAASVLAVRDTLPEVRHLTYDSRYGLSFQAPRGYVVWLGLGEIGRKVGMWRALEADLSANGLQPEHMDLRFPDSPSFGLAGVS
jgi:cell division septal protein FtsQ